ncbi:hypothetical protein F3Y22_tig00002840pilonHSYRG00374 [Hibiscus syriacus]|uniref:Uncharacterized protein n=1 Tax=Hibiscus syriacus TaxID=106335 RepID=A0A6A3CPP7_HIBSY|nr:hypothetical protein F3Y22_tig00002840pilonHSYRG00374 [Hibiscus syriacus]
MEIKPAKLYYYFPVILIFTVSVLVSVAVVPFIKTNAVALLMFNKMISNDPTGVLLGWKLGMSPCVSYGVKCSLGRVVHLELNQCRLYGTIFFIPLASLNMLSTLVLSGNMFIVNSTNLMFLQRGLKRLELSDTDMFGLFHDTIFSKLSILEYIDLSYSNLTGSLHADLEHNMVHFRVQQHNRFLILVHKRKKKLHVKRG